MFTAATSMWERRAAATHRSLRAGCSRSISLPTRAVVNRLNLTPVAKGGGGIWSTPSVDSVANTIWVTTGNTGISGPPNGYNWSQAIVGINGTNVCQPQGSTCSVKGYYHLNSGSGADIDFGAGATVYRLSNGTSMVVATNKNGVAYAFYATTLKATGRYTCVDPADIQHTPQLGRMEHRTSCLRRRYPLFRGERDWYSQHMATRRVPRVRSGRSIRTGRSSGRAARPVTFERG